MGLHLVPANTNIDFVGKRWVAFALTAILMVASVVSFSVKGFNLGIDFNGGILIEAAYMPEGTAATVDVADLRNRMATLELGEIALQTIGDDHTILLRVQQQEGDDSANNVAVEKIKTALGSGWTYARAESVGPTVGAELMRDGFMGISLAMLAIAIYVMVRFEWQFGVSALLCTFHDVFVSLGLISLLGLEFNLTTMAALMLLAGYSINDTVIVFDRIREELRRYKSLSLRDVINLSVNRTLSRTILTSSSTALVILPMLFLAHETLFDFTAVILWGILVGTYSSIYVAATFLIYMPPLRSVKAPASPETNSKAKAA